MTRTLRWLLPWSVVLTGIVRAEDWYQWRGPQRNGIVATSPPLVDRFPKTGPKRLWTSEKLLGGTSGGWGSVSVADGKAFVYSNWKYKVPTDTRTLDRNKAAGLGWAPMKVPDKVMKAIEAARTSDQRAKLKRRELNAWIKKWVGGNLTGRDKRFGGVAWSRLRAGPDMIPPALLDKLGPVVNKRFETEQAMRARLRELGFDDAPVKRVLAVVPKHLDHAKDAVLCLAAATGKTLWRYEVEGRAYGWPCSSTPCIVDGRCYVQGSDGYVFCLDVTTGKEVWRVLSKARRNAGTSSSFVIEQGVAVLLAGPLTGLDPATGKTLWTQPGVRSDYASTAYYRTGGKTYLVCNGKSRTFCVEPATGKTLWHVPGGGWATPAIVGNDMAVLTSNKKIGLVTYKLAPTGAKKTWDVPLVDRGASVLIYNGAVYAFGGRGNAKAIVLDLATGKVSWQEKLANTEFSSPIVADGKIIGVVGRALYLWEANPSEYKVLGQAKLGIETCVSPALVNGILYLRLRNHIAAYDLRRSPEQHAGTSNVARSGSVAR